ncbi:hypothetical protein B296_00016277 [Ensete ventricosum]|uniref:Uncharacterized protein n=1 Tax=Ensete ventricosum TaxID=4639 RepID=A0A426YU19_ENSVE|nr:hypothetical protein B296_00016277 [Ensete ventricosum]
MPLPQPPLPASSPPPLQRPLQTVTAISSSHPLQPLQPTPVAIFTQSPLPSSSLPCHYRRPPLFLPSSSPTPTIVVPWPQSSSLPHNRCHMATASYVSRRVLLPTLTPTPDVEMVVTALFLHYYRASPYEAPIAAPPPCCSTPVGRSSRRCYLLPCR